MGRRLRCFPGKADGGHEARDEHGGGEEPGHVLAGEDLPAGTWSKSSCPATPGNSEVGGEAPTREASLLSST